MRKIGQNSHFTDTNLLADGHRIVQTDLLQVAFLHLQSILWKNMSSYCTDTFHMMCICFIFKLFGFFVEMSQGFTLKEQLHQVELCWTGHQTISGNDQVELG